MSQQKNSILINEHALNREPVPLSSYFHSASQSCPILPENCTFAHFTSSFISWRSLSRYDKSSSATCLLYSDVVKGELPRGQGKIGKTTKKKPWKGQSRSRRFSFHKFYKLFFFFCFNNFFTLSLFFYSFFTHDIHPHPHPRPTTSTHYPRPTTFSYTPLNSETKVPSSTRGILQGYLKDSNAAAHSVDADISKAVIHLRALDLKNRKWL